MSEANPRGASGIPPVPEVPQVPDVPRVPEVPDVPEIPRGAAAGIAAGPPGILMFTSPPAAASSISPDRR